MVAAIVWMFAACTSARVPVARIPFFPGPADAELQAAAHVAVVEVLAHLGATITAGRDRSDGGALASLPCPGDATIVAGIRLRPSRADQSLDVRFCTAAAAATARCWEERSSVAVAPRCAEHFDHLFSSIERDLADHLMGKVRVTAVTSRGWWDDGTLPVMLSRVLRRPASILGDATAWWSVSGQGSGAVPHPTRAASATRSVALLTPMTTSSAPAQRGSMRSSTRSSIAPPR